MPEQSRARPLRILVVDDRAMPRIAARAMLSGAVDMTLVGEAASAAEALSVAQAMPVDLVLMDVDMAEMDGAEATRRLLSTMPNLTILAWTVSDSPDDLLRMIQAGCVGYVLKDVGPEELQRAIRAAIRGDAAVPRRMLPEILKSAAHHVAPPHLGDVTLTDRERETLGMIAKGFPTKKIALQMGITSASVDTHLRNIYRKLGASNRGEAVSRAVRAGLLSVADL